MAALTRNEAEQRAAAVTVTRYGIDLDLTAPGDRFISTTTLDFTAAAPQTFVEIACEELLDATLDGVALAPGLFVDGRLHLAGLSGTHRLVVRAAMRYSHDGEGLHRFVDPADGAPYLYATSAVDNAQRWFACFDQPDLKAPFEVSVSCPDGWTVYGNGASVRVADGRWTLAATPPISTYLVTLIAGPWHTRLGEHDGIPLGLHARAALAAELDRDASYLFALTADALDAFHELFGIRYPFGQYHQAFMPEFNWGAMEHPGCVTFRDQLLFRSRPSDAERIGRATTVVHEMAHMWFGDLVTMRWWDDLWLNESFAEYLGHRVLVAISDEPAWQDFAMARKGWGYDADRRDSTHPIAGNGAPDARAALDDFDGISYAKGASVLRQLAAYLGDAMFLAGLRDHIRTHEYGNATFADLLDAWCANAAPGTPTADHVRHWADEWLRREGVDIIEVHGTDLVRRPPLFGPPADRPHAISVAALPGRSSTALVLTGDPAQLEPARQGLLLPNAGDETWAVLRLDPAHWQRVPELLQTLPYSPSRPVLWNALRTALADGLITPELAVRAVVAGTPDEIDVVTARVFDWIIGALPRFVAPGAERAAMSASLVTAARGLLDTAAPAGSGQLTAARSWLALTDDIGQLRAWTVGAEPVSGLIVDVDLSWSALQRRAALGDLTASGIDAAFDADRSASGSLHAARCRALRPDPASKATVWSALTSPAAQLSDYELQAMAGGFWVPGQEALLDAYPQRWFTDFPPTAAFRGTWSLRRLAATSFPALLVRAETVARADELAARPDVSPGLRRIASDGAVEMSRALAVRAAAGAATA